MRPSHRKNGNVTRSILPPCSIHGMRGSRKTQKRLRLFWIDVVKITDRWCIGNKKVDR